MSEFSIIKKQIEWERVETTSMENVSTKYLIPINIEE